jgi:hypothetical protein
MLIDELEINEDDAQQLVLEHKRVRVAILANKLAK